MRLRADDWKLRKGGWKALDAGLLRSYERGRRGLDCARESEEAADLHQWRKRVKDLWYHERLLAPVCGRVVQGHAKELDRIAELLGDDHDLAVLREQLTQNAIPVVTDLDAVLTLIDHRRRELEAEAFRLGAPYPRSLPRPTGGGCGGPGRLGARSPGRPTSSCSSTRSCEHLRDRDAVAVRVGEGEAAGAVADRLDRSRVDSSFGQAGEFGVEIVDDQRQQPAACPGRVDHDIDQAGLGQLPHRFVRVRVTVRWAAEDLLVPGGSSSEFGRWDPREDVRGAHAQSGRLANPREDLLGRGVVTRVPRHVGPGDLARGRDHHRAAELRRVAERAALELAAAKRGEDALRDHLRADEVAETADLGAGRAIAGAVLVGQDRELDLLAAPEVGGMSGRQLTDQHDVRARCAKLLASAVQLDRVCLAIESAVMAQPDERRRAVLPEAGEPDVVAVLVR